MKKVLSNKIFLIVITGIICISGTITATTYLYNSNQIAYGDTNVKDSLDELYNNMKNNNKSDVAAVNVYNLGGVGTYQISTLYPDIDYAKLTSDNFYVKVTGLSISGSFRLDSEKRASGSSPSAGAVSWSYDATTGTLVSYSTSGGGIYYNGGSGEGYAYASASASVFMVIPTNAIK